MTQRPAEQPTDAGGAERCPTPARKMADCDCEGCTDAAPCSCCEERSLIADRRAAPPPSDAPTDERPTTSPHLEMIALRSETLRAFMQKVTDEAALIEARREGLRVAACFRISSRPLKGESKYDGERDGDIEILANHYFPRRPVTDAPAPASCPRCGSPDRSYRPIIGTAPDGHVVGAHQCPDAWHSGAPAVSAAPTDEPSWGFAYLKTDPAALDELATRLPDGDMRNGSSKDRAYLRATADRIRSVVAYIERSSPSAGLRAQGWLPMESAPRDGSDVLAWRSDWDRAGFVQWRHNYRTKTDFWNDRDEQDAYEYEANPPTHWFPVAALPAASSPDATPRDTEDRP